MRRYIVYTSKQEIKNKLKNGITLSSEYAKNKNIDTTMPKNI